MSVAELVNRGLGIARARARGYRVIIEPEPSEAFLDALHELVGNDDTGQWVYRKLAEPTRVRKQHLLVLHRGEPVLALTLRKRASFWEPATANVAPHLRLPHRDGHLAGALSASLQHIEIPEYFGPADDFEPRHVTTFPVYIASLQEPHYSEHWSAKTKSDIARDKRKANLGVIVNDETTLSWLVDRWYENWREHPADEVCARDDLLAVLPGLFTRGVLTTVALTHQQQVVAAQASVVQDSKIIGLVIARDKESVVRRSLGTLLIVESMETARAAGFEQLDMGGYLDEHKSRMAPAGGVRHTIRIRPEIPCWIERLGKCRRIDASS